jgi:predicted dienelactone hydrolase
LGKIIDTSFGHLRLEYYQENSMKKFEFIGTMGLGLLSLFACNSASVAPPAETFIETQSKATPTITKSVAETPTLQTTAISSQVTKEPPTLLLSKPGKYFAGNREYTLVDNSRDGREIELLIWYPAHKQTDADGRAIVRDAIPDMGGAPYPVILTEEDSGRYIFLSHLATHGFVMVVVKSPKSEPPEKFIVFQQVRDFLFSLDQISANPPDELENLINTDRVGVTGYSYGGDIALTVSGARVDPEFYISQCEQVSTLVRESFHWVYEDYYCQDAKNWDAFVNFIGEEITSNDDGLWQPITDERIRAVMPMASTVSWYYGERGLAEVDRPTFLIWGTKDLVSPYQLEVGFTFEHIEIPERFLISFIGKTHMMPFSPDVAVGMKHFGTAFFGYYLQDRKDYTEYFSKDFVEQFDDLFWGVYSDD